LKNVTFAHRKKVILSGVDIDIPANQITVLQGASGAGKTTLIDMLIGLHRPASGEVLVGGVPLEDLDLKAWRGQIGYVPQELHLLHASIRDNVTLGDTSISDERVINALQLAGVTELLNRKNGLDAWVGEMGSKLSGGQRQRISIARALVTEPKLLIFDEVTSALDPETEAGIVESIRGLKSAFTIIAVTHRPAWSAVADRLYLVVNRQAQLLKPSLVAAKPKRGAVSRKAPAKRQRRSRT
jgi:ATP-binding cassette subfamily C protein